ncbi:MAG: DUF1573 domain-containing protein [Saprospiraceae bacterium]|nr:DUF1573 domain-containing protein [Saprospiraceae bacterium]MBK7812715.1 DUF1573 domain-containing protein [Saprospiraceae bacterium]MBK9630906.1 DUF1573 domain-containing protein [Saprospiraceae bacterium]
MKKWIWTLGLLGFFSFCQPKVKPEEPPANDSYLDPYLDAIRISASADQPEDSSHRAKIQFLESEYDFGKIKKGDTARLVFKFVNTGNARLIINRVTTTCGCTQPEWPKTFIQPGDTSAVEALFVSDDKMGPQHKTMSVFANTYPPQTDLTIKGMVLK